MEDWNECPGCRQAKHSQTTYCTRCGYGRTHRKVAPPVQPLPIVEALGYVHKATRVKATAWGPDCSHWAVVTPWDAYRQLPGQPHIRGNPGAVVHPGDYIVESDDGRIWVVEAETFGENYSPATPADAEADAGALLKCWHCDLPFHAEDLDDDGECPACRQEEGPPADAGKRDEGLAEIKVRSRWVSNDDPGYEVKITEISQRHGMPYVSFFVHSAAVIGSRSKADFLRNFHPVATPPADAGEGDIELAQTIADLRTLVDMLDDPVLVHATLDGITNGVEMKARSLRVLLAAAEKAGPGPVWRCNCGFYGLPSELKANASGIRTCPQCGGSGGLVANHPSVVAPSVLTADVEGLNQPRIAFQRAEAFIAEMNRLGCGFVLHGGLQAAIIAHANSIDSVSADAGKGKQ